MTEEIPLFFDFGGTLVDTLQVTRRVFKEVLGTDYTPEQIKDMYKDASQKRQSISLLIKYKVNPAKLALKQKKIKSMQKELFIDTIELNDKASEVLQKIKKLDKNLKLILVTQNPMMEDEEYSSQALTKLFGDNNPFDQILAGEDKFQMIVHNFDPDILARGVLIGDLPNDVYVAEMLKIPCFGVTWGYSEEDELRTPFIVDEIEDLYEMVQDHIEDLKEEKDEEIEEIEFEDIDLDSDDFELID
ncbi:MAG: HAD family hydrolase [Candidatus Heimdallarchaeota archaeon]|nr:HAD family hydrolase [Candidatus Heimdallarchaeota archaeon]